MNHSEASNILFNYNQLHELAITRNVIVVLTSFLLLILVFQNAIESIFFQGNTTLLNQFAVIILAFIACYIQLEDRLINTKFILVVGFLSYLIFVSILFGKNSSLFQIVAQSFLHVQLFIILFSLYIIVNKYSEFITKVFIISIVISIFGVLFQLLMPNWFVSIFTPSDQVLRLMNWGDLRIWGFQGNPNRLGVIFSFFLILLIFNKNIINNTKIRVLLIAISLLIIVLTSSRSAMIFLGIALIFSNINLTKKISMIFFLVVIMGIFGVLDYLEDKTATNIQNVVEYSSDETLYIRWLMTYHGTALAVENFPIGTGAATFGTALSHGSPVYHDVGIAELESVKTGRGIHDSNYGSIAGEFGIIGLILFFGLGWYFLKSIFESRKFLFINSDSIYYTILIISFIAVFMRPLFSSSYYSVLLALLIFSYTDKNPITFFKKVLK